jgi:hypothetical protein
MCPLSLSCASTEWCTGRYLLFEKSSEVMLKRGWIFVLRWEDLTMTHSMRTDSWVFGGSFRNRKHILGYVTGLDNWANYASGLCLCALGPSALWQDFGLSDTECSVQVTQIDRRGSEKNGSESYENILITSVDVVQDGRKAESVGMNGAVTCVPQGHTAAARLNAATYCSDIPPWVGFHYLVKVTDTTLNMQH